MIYKKLQKGRQRKSKPQEPDQEKLKESFIKIMEGKKGKEDET